MANGTIAFDTLQTSDAKRSGTTKSVDTSYVYNDRSQNRFQGFLVG